MRRDDFVESIRSVDNYIVAWTDVKMVLRRLQEQMPSEALASIDYIQGLSTNTIQVAISKNELVMPIVSGISNIFNRPVIRADEYEGYKPEPTVAIVEIVRAPDVDRRLTIIVTQRT